MTLSGFFISDGYLRADTETDRISEPGMIQRSPLKINRQTALHWSCLFISASLCASAFISAGPHRERRRKRGTHITSRLLPPGTPSRDHQVDTDVENTEILVFIGCVNSTSHAEIIPTFYLFGYLHIHFVDDLFSDIRT